MRPSWSVIWLVIGIVSGGVLSWLVLNKPPWIAFDTLNATYSDDAPNKIRVSGFYEVHRSCKATVIWRVEALSADGQVAIYGPTPTAPDLRPGTHLYNGDLPVTGGTRPIGWVVRVIAICATEVPETVSSGGAIVMASADE